PDSSLRFRTLVQGAGRLNADAPVDAARRTLGDFNTGAARRHVRPFGRCEAEHSSQQGRPSDPAKRIPPVACFRASYPCSNTGYSRRPCPFGRTRNSDSREEKTGAANSSRFAFTSANSASKGNLGLATPAGRGACPCPQQRGGWSKVPDRTPARLLPPLETS